MFAHAHASGRSQNAVHCAGTASAQPQAAAPGCAFRPSTPGASGPTPVFPPAACACAPAADACRPTFVFTPPGGGFRFALPGNEFLLKAGSLDTGGHAELFETTSVPGAEVPPHFHGAADEFLYIVEGAIALDIGGVRTVAGAGSFVYVKRGTPIFLTAPPGPSPPPGTVVARSLVGFLPGFSLGSIAGLAELLAPFLAGSGPPPTPEQVGAVSLRFCTPLITAPLPPPAGPIPPATDAAAVAVACARPPPSRCPLLKHHSSHHHDRHHHHRKGSRRHDHGHGHGHGSAHVACPPTPVLPTAVFPVPPVCNPVARPRAPIVLGPGEGPAFTVGAARFVLKASAADTEGSGELFEVTVAPGGTLGPLRFGCAALFFYVVRGRFAFRVGGTTVTAEARASVLVPPGAAFCASAAVPEGGTLFGIVLPAGGLGLFAALASGRRDDRSLARRFCAIAG